MKFHSIIHRHRRHRCRLLLSVSLLLVISINHVVRTPFLPTAVVFVTALDIMGTRVTFKNGVLRIRPPPPPSATSQSSLLLDLVVPPEGTTPPSNVIDSIELRLTKHKGYGAFASQPIEEGTFLGFYEGTIIKGRDNLDQVCQQRHERLLLGSTFSSDPSSSSSSTTATLKDGIMSTNDDDGSKDKKSKMFKTSSTGTNAMDYIMSLDGGVTFLDGYDRAQDRSRFSPVHLNHSDKDSPGCNCIRLLSDDEDDNGGGGGGDGGGGGNDLPRVAFFTSRLVEKGEELCFSYGDNFWADREDMKKI